jgi:hypothetical protein
MSWSRFALSVHTELRYTATAGHQLRHGRGHRLASYALIGRHTARNRDPLPVSIGICCDDLRGGLVDTYHVVLYIHLVSLLIGFSAGMIETVCLCPATGCRHARGGGAVGPARRGDREGVPGRDPRPVR